MIPDEAVKYLLFQRSGYQLYWMSPNWVRKIVRNLPFMSYNRIVLLQAALFKAKTKKLAQEDVIADYEALKDHFPKNAEHILDIGAGSGLADVLLYRRYQNATGGPHLYLLDKSQVDDTVYYGYEKRGSFYSSLAVAKNVLLKNGIPEDRIHMQEVDESNYKINFDAKFDLIVSIASWGWHYPVDVYLEETYRLLKPGGTLITSVKYDNDGEEKLKQKFGNIETIWKLRKGKYVKVIKPA